MHVHVLDLVHKILMSFGASQHHCVGYGGGMSSRDMATM